MFPFGLLINIQFSYENQRLYSNLKKLKRYVILGSLESISVYCVEPLQEIFEIKKPSFIKETVVPDAQIGIGRPPDVFMRFVKKDEKNHLLLIISWIILFWTLVNDSYPKVFNISCMDGFKTEKESIFGEFLTLLIVSLFLVSFCFF